jgi:hypothetical protein
VQPPAAPTRAIDFRCARAVSERLPLERHRKYARSSEAFASARWQMTRYNADGSRVAAAFGANTTLAEIEYRVVDPQDGTKRLPFSTETIAQAFETEPDGKIDGDGLVLEKRARRTRSNHIQGL